jgi:hypothetical protein
MHVVWAGRHCEQAVRGYELGNREPWDAWAELNSDDEVPNCMCDHVSPTLKDGACLEMYWTPGMHAQYCIWMCPMLPFSNSPDADVADNTRG